MGTIVGRGIRVEVGKTEGPEVTVSEVTNAKPAVASASGHSLVAKSLGYFKDVLGMPQLEGQACRLASVVAGTSFVLENLDTTTYSDYTGGKFVPITAWATVADTNSGKYPEATMAARRSAGSVVMGGIVPRRWGGRETGPPDRLR